MAEHTPGPWKVVPGYFDGEFVVVKDGPAGPSAMGITTVDGRGYSQNEANADLIAAAPDLLEALEVAVQIVASDGRCDPKCASTALLLPIDDRRCDCGIEEIIWRAKQAITKARGQAVAS